MLEHRNSGSEAKRLAQYQALSKSAGVAYLLWFFLGVFGAHRFYLGLTQSAVVMLVLWVGGWLLTFVVIGFAGLIAAGIWWFVDAFLLAGLVREHNLRLANSMD